jgi:hypothetical protein
MEWTGQNRTVATTDRTGLDTTGHDWLRPDRTGYDRTGLVTTGQGLRIEHSYKNAWARCQE